MTTSSFAAGAYASMQGMGTSALLKKPAPVGGLDGAGAGLPDFSSLVSKALESTAQSARQADTQVGKVAASSAKSSCQAKVPVAIYKGRKKVAKVTTKKNGSFVAPRGATGRLTVHLPPVYTPKGAAKLECGERWSRTFSVR